MIEIKSIAERLILDMSEITCIIYRNEDMGIDGRRFKHIDVEVTYGEYIELVESDLLYQEIYEQSKLSEIENAEEVILFKYKRINGEKRDELK